MAKLSEQDVIEKNARQVEREYRKRFLERRLGTDKITLFKMRSDYRRNVLTFQALVDGSGLRPSQVYAMVKQHDHYRFDEYGPRSEEIRKTSRQIKRTYQKYLELQHRLKELLDGETI